MEGTEQSLTVQRPPTSHLPGCMTSREALCQQYFTRQIFPGVGDLANTSPATDPAGYLHTGKDQSNSKGYHTVGLARSTGQRGGANKDSVVAPGPPRPSLTVCSQPLIFSLFKAG